MFTAAIPETASFRMGWKVWQKIGGATGRLNNEWTRTMTQYIKKANRYCSLAFKQKWRKKRKSRKKSDYVFRCSRRCTFSNCPVAFSANIKNYNESSPPSLLYLNVMFTGTIQHCNTERRARRLRGEQRESLQQMLAHTKPSTLFNSSMCNLDETILSSGNRDNVGCTPSVVQKISSEGRQKEVEDVDLITSLKCLKKSFDEQVSGGYIQTIIAQPFGVIAFMEKAIRIYHNLGTDNTIYLDATGTIASLKQTDYSTVRPLYYALVIKHPKKGNPPVALAEFITGDQSVLSIHHFLNTFIRHESILYKTSIKPKHIVIDRSMTLLISILQAYNMESISDYLHRCFRIIMGMGEETDYEKSMVHACIAHVMKSMKHHLKTFW